MPTRFVYHERIRNSKWPFLFKVLGATSYGTTDVLPSKKRVDLFEKYLLLGDETADVAAKDLFMSSRSHGQSFKMMNRVFENGLDGCDDIPDSFRNLMDEVHAEPDWLDRQKLEDGAAVCRRLGGWAMSVLGDLALCGGYANPDITKPLLFTGALKGERTFDRVSETSQFWVDVTRPGAMEIGSKGFKVALRVRMMHAIVRLRLSNHPDWDNHSRWWPINEADSLATNVGFSMAMIFGCKMLGFSITSKEIEAVLHLWRYIGFLMGDDHEWLPKNASEGLQCLLRINLSTRNIPDEGSR